jgi:hypothetical protein
MILETQSIIKEKTISNLEFINAFGAIFKNEFIINNNGTSTTLEFNNVKKVVMTKKRNLKWNYVSFLLSIPFLLFYFFYLKDLLLVILMIIHSVVLIGSLFMFKVNDYKLIFFVEYDVIEIKVDPSYKNQAKTFINKINSKVKKAKSK